MANVTDNWYPNAMTDDLIGNIIEMNNRYPNVNLNQFWQLPSVNGQSYMWDPVQGMITTSSQNVGNNGLFGGLTTQEGLGIARTALGGLGLLGGLYNSWNSNRLASQQLNYQKQLANANLANQIQSYNNSLLDRMQARAATETGDKNAYDQEYENRKLANATIG